MTFENIEQFHILTKLLNYDVATTVFEYAFIGVDDSELLKIYNNDIGAFFTVYFEPRTRFPPSYMIGIDEYFLFFFEDIDKKYHAFVCKIYNKYLDTIFEFADELKSVKYSIYKIRTFKEIERREKLIRLKIIVDMQKSAAKLMKKLNADFDQK